MPEYSEISLRKMDHLRICLNEDVDFRKSNGFDQYEFLHQALPEADLLSIDLSTQFLGRGMRMPFFIEALTGGAPGTEKINRNLATAAQKLSIGMGVGSQRAMLIDPKLSYTYKVRDVAPDIFLLGNIGATQINGTDLDQLVGMVGAIGADGLAVHLNPLQEMIQPEGDKDWRNVRKSIENICKKVNFPVIAKESGCGISGRVATQLQRVGVAAIDVAGAGGTSFARVEHYRGAVSAAPFLEWGIATAESLKQCRQAVTLPLVASGGIRSGLDSAKAIAMGASIVGLARKLLKPAMESPNEVIRVIEDLAQEMRMTMVLVGARNIRELQKVNLY